MEQIVENRSILSRLAEIIRRKAFLAEAALVVRNGLMRDGRDSRVVANYMLKRAVASGRTLTVMHLLKLVYVAHGWWMGLTGRPLIRDQVEAWRLGPVIPRVYDEFRPGTLEIPCLIMHSSGKPYYANDFTASEREIMDMVYDMYSPLSAHALSDLTHEEGAPWDQVKDKGDFAVIPNKIIGDYYRDQIKAAKGQAA